MKTRATTKPEASAPPRFDRRAVLVLGGLLLGFLLLVAWVPLSTTVQIGADEGFELAKATLCLKGHHLYTEVWNDQPPLDTVLLTQILRHITPSILGPRLMTVGFSLLLLTGTFLAVLRLHGLGVAALATGLVIGSPAFLELGCSAMLEVPALAPVVFALALLLWARPGRGWLIFTAGLFFALGLQIKWIGALYLPVAGLILWLGPKTDTGKPEPIDAKGTGPWTRWLRPSPGLSGAALRFAAGLVLGFVVLTALIDDGSFLLQVRQSWSSHFGATKTLAYGSPADHPFAWAVLLRNWDVTGPALAGIALLALQRGPTGRWVPVVWLGLTLLVFGLHRPWWNYYYLHEAVPLAWCAAVGLHGAGSWALRRRGLWREAFGALCVVLAAWTGARVWIELSDLRKLPQTYATPVIAEMARYREATEYLYTEEPVYSFHAGLPLPPKLGVVPRKRFWSGELTQRAVVDELARVRPGLVLVRNDSREPPSAALLQSDYRLVYYDEGHRLYALRGLKPKGR
jgi:hypothetical protein